MPIFFQQETDENTKLAVWKIAEDESFFLQHVPLQREITHPHKRLQHLAGRYLLQYLFADFPINLIKIADTRKPYLENEAYHFSISHCSDYAAAIVSKTKRVGVDIEVPTHKVEKIKHKFLHEDELLWASHEQSTISQQGNQLPVYANSKPQTPNTKLTLLWCAKEAAFKWWSYGNVDFSEMIRLKPFSLGSTGTIEGAFVETQRHALELHFQIFAEVCLVWIVK